MEQAIKIFLADYITTDIEILNEAIQKLEDEIWSTNDQEEYMEATSKNSPHIYELKKRITMLEMARKQIKDLQQ